MKIQDRLIASVTAAGMIISQLFAYGMIACRPLPVYAEDFSEVDSGDSLVDSDDSLADQKTDISGENPIYTIEHYYYDPQLQFCHGNGAGIDDLIVVDGTGIEKDKWEDLNKKRDYDMYVRLQDGKIPVKSSLEKVFDDTKADYFTKHTLQSMSRVEIPESQQKEESGTNDHYRLCEIWIQQPDTSKPTADPMSEDNSFVLASDTPGGISNDQVHFTNDPQNAELQTNAFEGSNKTISSSQDAWTVLIQPGTRIRLVFQPTEGETTKQDVNFFDYDISDGNVYVKGDDGSDPDWTTPHRASSSNDLLEKGKTVVAMTDGFDSTQHPQSKYQFNTFELQNDPASQILTLTMDAPSYFQPTISIQFPDSMTMDTTNGKIWSEVKGAWGLDFSNQELTMVAGSQKTTITIHYQKPSALQSERIQAQPEGSGYFLQARAYKDGTKQDLIAGSNTVLIGDPEYAIIKSQKSSSSPDDYTTASLAVEEGTTVDYQLELRNYTDQLISMDLQNQVPEGMECMDPAHPMTWSSVEVPARAPGVAYGSKTIDYSLLAQDFADSKTQSKTCHCSLDADFCPICEEDSPIVTNHLTTIITKKNTVPLCKTDAYSGLGINSVTNYKDFDPETSTDVRFGFGNNNTGVRLGNTVWNGNKINAFNAGTVGNAAFGLADGLTTVTDENGQTHTRLLWNEGISAPDIFTPDNGLIGKTDFASNEFQLKFSRLGGTYTIHDVLDDQGNVIDSASNLDTFEPMEQVGNAKMVSNNFWPMDAAETFGQDAHDLKTGGSFQHDSRKYGPVGGNEIALPRSDWPRGHEELAQDHNSYFGMNFDVDFSLVPDYCAPLRYFFYGDDDMFVFLSKVDDNGNIIEGTTKKIADIGGVHSSLGMYTNIWKAIENRPVGTAIYGQVESKDLTGVQVALAPQDGAPLPGSRNGLDAIAVDGTIYATSTLADNGYFSFNTFSFDEPGSYTYKVYPYVNGNLVTDQFYTVTITTAPGSTGQESEIAPKTIIENITIKDNKNHATDGIDFDLSQAVLPEAASAMALSDDGSKPELPEYGTKYRLTFFYTERGESGSSCYMNYTIPVGKYGGDAFQPEITPNPPVRHELALEKSQTIADDLTDSGFEQSTKDPLDTPLSLEKARTLRYFVKATNVGDQVEQGLTITDTIPIQAYTVSDQMQPVQTYTKDSAQILGIEDENGNLHPAGPKDRILISDTEIDWEIESLKPKESAIVAFDVDLPEDLDQATIWSNQAFIKSHTVAPTPSNTVYNQKTPPEKPSKPGDLKLEKARLVTTDGEPTLEEMAKASKTNDPPLVLKAQDTLRYYLKATNTGKMIQHHVEISETIPVVPGSGDLKAVLAYVPDSAKFVDPASPEGGQISVGLTQIIWQLDELQPGQTMVAAFDVKVPDVTQKTTWKNIAQIVSDETPTTPSNPVESVQKPSKPDPGSKTHPFTIEKSQIIADDLKDSDLIDMAKDSGYADSTMDDLQKPLELGKAKTLRYLIKVSNHTSTPQMDVEITDSIPVKVYSTLNQPSLVQTYIPDSARFIGLENEDGQIRTISKEKTKITASNTLLTWTIDTLKPHESVIVAFDVNLPTIKEKTIWSNQAAARCQTIEPIKSNTVYNQKTPSGQPVTPDHPDQPDPANSLNLEKWRLVTDLETPSLDEMSKASQISTPPLAVQAGDTLRYYLKAKNTGQNTQHHVRIVESIPVQPIRGDLDADLNYIKDSAVFVSPTHQNGLHVSVTDHEIEWMIDALKPGETAIAAFDVKVPEITQETIWSNTAAVASDEVPKTPSNTVRSKEKATPPSDSGNPSEPRHTPAPTADKPVVENKAAVPADSTPTTKATTTLPIQTQSTAGTESITKPRSTQSSVKTGIETQFGAWFIAAAGSAALGSIFWIRSKQNKKQK